MRTIGRQDGEAAGAPLRDKTAQSLRGDPAVSPSKLGVAAALLLAACAEPAIPIRVPAYSFADTVIIGVDTTVTVFNWPADRLPVRFYADPRGYMRTIVQRAVDTWAAQFLYGEFTGTLVADSTQADVIVVWASGVPPEAEPDPGPPQFACDGQTIYPAADPTDTLTGPIHVELDLVGGSFTPAVIAACMRRTAIHEVGHALGLLRHSTFDTNILFAPPQVALPNPGDRRTVELLYHTRPTLFPPRR